ncbi:MAG: hypothetical protein COA58_03430 [Bacteroidetes bacterium]|nr:MAG: hypothetical protein COA58_03430 [Bacteroidota bacterium]
MGRYFAIFRPLNILFIALAQWLCAYYLDFSASFDSINEGGIYWLILGTSACAAFGYWVNDFLDQDRDSINKDRPSAIRLLDDKVVYIHLLAFVSVAMLAGNILGIWFVGLFVITLLILFLYSKYFKNVAMLGNFMIAALCFTSLLAVAKLFLSTDYLLVLHFATLASFVTFAREIVKDAEDLEGDMQTGANTAPVSYGLQSVNSSVLVISIFSVAFSLISIYYQKSHFHDTLRYVYFIYVTLFLILPLFYVGVKVMVAKAKEDYRHLSAVLKYILYCGILSILFF